jgi:predicted nucleic acid-binding protein
LASKPKYYWDACLWIGLINQEPDKIDSLKFIIDEAQKGKVEIWTSAFTLAEVFKRKCDSEQSGIDESDDVPFEDYIKQDFVQRVQVDSDVGTAARRILRKFPSIRKPQDAIHAATAALNNVDEFHTFDDKDLTPLDGQIPMANGQKLKICRPSAPPPPLPVVAEKAELPLLAILEQMNLNESRNKIIQLLWMRVGEDGDYKDAAEKEYEDAET